MRTKSPQQLRRIGIAFLVFGLAEMSIGATQHYSFVPAGLPLVGVGLVFLARSRRAQNI